MNHRSQVDKVEAAPNAILQNVFDETRDKRLASFKEALKRLRTGDLSADEAKLLSESILDKVGGVHDVS